MEESKMKVWEARNNKEQRNQLTSQTYTNSDCINKMTHWGLKTRWI